MPPQRLTPRQAKAPRPTTEVVRPEDEVYRAYREALIDRHIEETLGSERFEQMVQEKARELKRNVGSFKTETIKQVSIAMVRGLLLKDPVTKMLI